MPLALRPPFAPMEALSVDEIPQGKDWQYEPKWDGFRCLVFRDGAKVELQSKAGHSLTRYFPELVEAVRKLKAKMFVLDGEIVVPQGVAFSFDALLQRIHPAASRVKTLAHDTPAMLIVFDLLAGTDGRSLADETLAARRKALEKFAGRFFVGGQILLSPATVRLADAKGWLKRVGATLDGIIAKRRDLPYRSGDRSGMQKIKNYRSADCVVGGFRYNEGTRVVGSLLLGLYDDAGLLHHVGFTSSIKARREEGADCTAQKAGRARRASPAMRRAARAGGRPSVRRNGNRSSRSSWSRSATTISPATASATARGCCAGVPTRRRGNARWIR